LPQKNWNEKLEICRQCTVFLEMFNQLEGRQKE
jgi:hypothetical protein